MRAIVVALALSVWLLDACGGPAASAPQTERAASVTAETAFAKGTEHRITHYILRPGEHTSSKWYFHVTGTEEFALPGNNWIVTVDKKTGRAELIGGQ